MDKGPYFDSTNNASPAHRRLARAWGRRNLGIAQRPIVTVERDAEDLHEDRIVTRLLIFAALFVAVVLVLTWVQHR